MTGFDEKDKERLRAQLSIIQETSTKRWDILLSSTSLLAAGAALLSQGNLIHPLWLGKTILILSIVSIPIALVLYERSLREKQAMAEHLLQSIFEEYGVDMGGELNKFRGGWDSWLPKGSVYFVSLITLIMVIGVLIGWRK